jgi:hypothetical protein
MTLFHNVCHIDARYSIFSHIPEFTGRVERQEPRPFAYGKSADIYMGNLTKEGGDITKVLTGILAH